MHIKLIFYEKMQKKKKRFQNVRFSNIYSYFFK